MVIKNLTAADDTPKSLASAQPPTPKETAEDIEELNVRALASFQQSPFAFIEAALGEIPQPIKAEHKEHVLRLYTVPAHEFSEYSKTITKQMFEPFVKGLHLTWQQCLVVIAIQRAVNGSLPPRIAVKAGRGVGKSNIMSKLILWYLFSFPLSRIPCTAPTADQLFAVLWSEINLTLSRMKPEYADMFEWSSDFIRIKQKPQIWYARAKTAGKGQTGALSGIHADYMASFADEAYDIEDDVFQVAEATQTGEKSLMFLVGNAVHDHGFFFNCFQNDGWIQITMNGEDSPIVNPQVVIDAEKTYGRNSNHYRASITGEFPIATAVDIDGYSRMFTDDWIESLMSPIEHDFGDDEFRIGRSFLGIDPSGEGTDEMVGYLRNASKAKVAFAKTGGGVPSCTTLTIGAIEMYGLEGSDATCDNFGVGAELSQEVMIKSNSQHVIGGKNLGDKCEDILDQAAYLNDRARVYDMLYWWGKRGGRILYDEILAKELKTIFKKKNEAGKMMIMPKREMRKRLFPSPNRADAVVLSFVNDRMMQNYVPRAEYRGAHLRQKKATAHDDYDRHDLVPFM